MKKSFWIAATAASLAACGGSNGGGGEFAAPASTATSPAREPVDASPKLPAARAFSYKAVQIGAPFGPEAIRGGSPVVNVVGSAVTLEARRQLIANEGASGWRHVNAHTMAYGSSGKAWVNHEIFIKGGSQTYAYEWTSPAANAAALQAQLDEHGGRGFRVGPHDAQEYRKANGSTSVFSYRVIKVEPPPFSSEAELLTRAKAQGAAGYRQIGDTLNLGTESVRIYEKELNSSGIYDYEALPAPANDASLLAQLNTQGARGYRFKTSYDFGMEGSDVRHVYEKDLSQSSSTFRFYALEYDPSVDANFVQANAEGAKGNLVVGPKTIDGVKKMLYLTPENCSGYICEPGFSLVIPR